MSHAPPPKPPVLDPLPPVAQVRQAEPQPPPSYYRVDPEFLNAVHGLERTHSQERATRVAEEIHEVNEIEDALNELRELGEARKHTQSQTTPERGKAMAPATPTTEHSGQPKRRRKRSR